MNDFYKKDLINFKALLPVEDEIKKMIANIHMQYVESALVAKPEEIPALIERAKALRNFYIIFEEEMKKFKNKPKLKRDTGLS
jgi:hypothetical protein